MNAHSNASPAASITSPTDELLRSECNHMLGIIDQQLADLEDIQRTLLLKREQWAEKLNVIEGSGGSAASKAPHGSVKSTILRELRSTKDGLDIQTLVQRISAALPNLNQRSVRQAITRMHKAGLIEEHGSRWRHLT